MRILLAHNYYQQPGGEDAVFAADAALLREYGHEVVEYTEDNARIRSMNKFAVGAQTIWSRPTQHRLRQVLRAARPDVAHFHNTFLLISPAAYSTCHTVGVPVVQVLHNYRLLCPTATFYRAGRVCEDCLQTSFPWPALIHKCWRASRSQTAVAAAMLSFHRWSRTWREEVDVYVALSEFARRKFVQGGIPEEKIAVKPNFVHRDPGERRKLGDYALFVGRLAPEKGLETLLAAWRDLKGIPLKVVGDGPLFAQARSLDGRENLRCIDFLGQQSNEVVLALMQEARFVVLPSEWYENFPMTIVEAYACGVPVVASRLGAMTEIVEDARTGLLFNPGDPHDLAAKARWAWTHPQRMQQMGREARRRYKQQYSAAPNYTRLMDIYRQAMDRQQASIPI